MRLFYNQLNCHSDKWPNNANTRVASLSVVLERNNSVTSMRAPELTLGYRHKCSLFKREVRFLGRIVSGDSYRMDPESVKAVEKLKETLKH